MKLAIHNSNFILAGADAPIVQVLTDVARAADEGGISQMTLMDHYFQIAPVSPNAGDPMLEGYTTLGYLAGQTKNLTLGLLVTGVTYRHPGLLAKIVTTLDLLSNGRAQLGIGAAWYDREHVGLGVPYPSTAERFERLEEAIQICRQMWSDNNGPFNGKHYQLAETLNSPQSVQPGGPRILIGGMGEKKTLRLVAKYGDACNLFPLGHDEIARKLDILREHCETEGTDYDRIEKTIMIGTDAVADTDAFLKEVDGYAKLGISQVWNGPASSDPVAWVNKAVNDVLPRLKDI